MSCLTTRRRGASSGTGGRSVEKQFEMLSVWRANGAGDSAVGRSPWPRPAAVHAGPLLGVSLAAAGTPLFAGKGPERPGGSGSTQRGAERGPPTSDTGRGAAATEPPGPAGEPGDAYGGGAELRGGAGARSADSEPTDASALDGVRVIRAAAASSAAAVVAGGPATKGELRTRKNHLIDASNGVGEASATHGRRTLYIHSQSSGSHQWNQELDSESSR